MMRPFLWLLATLFCAPLHALELLRWKRIPLPVALHVGQERLVFVDKNVEVGYPAALEGKIRIQSSGGVVYLLAHELLPVTRLQLRDAISGELLLLDIQATASDTPLEPVKLVYEAPPAKREGPTTDPLPPALPPQEPAAVRLTRYAAQMLYAPLRAVEPLPGVQPVAVHLPKRITTLLPSLPVDARPLAAWRLDDDTVTAVRLRNRQATRLDLDPRQLQGHFIAATFQHDWLASTGAAQDTTVVYLMTRGEPANAFIPEPPAGKKHHDAAN